MWLANGRTRPDHKGVNSPLHIVNVSHLQGRKRLRAVVSDKALVFPAQSAGMHSITPKGTASFVKEGKMSYRS